MCSDLREAKLEVMKHIVDFMEWQVPPYTHAVLWVELDGQENEFSGFSKQNPVDEWDNARGSGLAYSRALAQAAYWYLERKEAKPATAQHKLEQMVTSLTSAITSFGNGLTKSIRM